MSSRRIAIVANELHPFTNGGIGVLLHNQLATFGDDGNQYHIIFIANGNGNGNPLSGREAVIGTYFPGVEVHMVGKEYYLPTGRNGEFFPPEWAFRAGAWHARSYAVMRLLKELEENGTVFDLIEFPDFGGVGFCTLQERALGQAFQQTTIAIRVHSAFSALTRYEPRPPSPLNSRLFDLERKCYRDADVIVAHIPAVAEVHRETYGLEAQDWGRRLRIELPPVLVQGAAPRGFTLNRTTPILFTSKIQPFKAPDTFVRGVAEFMDTSVAYQGNAIIAAHAFDQDYEANIRALVPPHLRKRVQFNSGIQGEARTRLIGRAVCVFPSVFESFCLAAYEASLLGAVVVLNQNNPGFGPTSPWLDGVNCVKFDGTAPDLTRILQRLFDEDLPRIELQVVDCAPSRPYWSDDAAIDARPRWLPLPLPRPLVSVVMTGFSSGSALIAGLENLRQIIYPLIEIVVVDSTPADSLAQTVLRQLRASDVTVVRTQTTASYGERVNAGAAFAKGDYLLLVDADDVIDSRFVGMAVTALERSPQYDVVVPQKGLFKKGDEFQQGEFANYSLSLGEGYASGFHENMIAGAPALIRRSVWAENRYDERLPALEHWDFFFRLVHSGRRFIVTNEVMAFSPRTNWKEHLPPLTRNPGTIIHQILSKVVASTATATIPSYVLAGLIYEDARGGVVTPVLREYDIVITATGQKNPAAQGTEVWVTSFGFRGRNRPTEYMTEVFGWKQDKGGAFFSHDNQPASIRWRGWLPLNGSLSFGTHLWSGIAELTVNGQRRRLDLYSTDGGSIEIFLANFGARDHQQAEDPSVLEPAGQSWGNADVAAQLERIRSEQESAQRGLSEAQRYCQELEAARSAQEGRIEALQRDLWSMMSERDAARQEVTKLRTDLLSILESTSVRLGILLVRIGNSISPRFRAAVGRLTKRVLRVGKPDTH